MKKLLSQVLFDDLIQLKETDSPFEKTLDMLKESIQENGFGIQAIHDLKKTYQKHNLPLEEDFEYQIIQICEPKKSHKALTELSFDMGVMMPKSIIIAKENGKTTLRYLKWKPWMVSLMFPDIDIAPISKNVAGTMEKIVQDTLRKASQMKNIE